MPKLTEHSFREAHAALDRMRRAHKRGTGCHLTAAMIEDLGLTFLGETWQEENPTAALQQKDQA